MFPRPRKATDGNVIARPEQMRATLQMLHEEYGSVEAYVLQVCQLSPEAIAHLRRNLVVGAPEGDGCRQSHSGRIEPLKHIACATLVSETARAL